jgi:adenylosuccinate lyase
MIKRYTRDEMGRLWTDAARYAAWLEVEIAVCEGWNRLGAVPDADLKTIREKARFDVTRLLELEKETRHDVIAFVSAVAENVGEASRFIHLGVTSSDILDTAFALMLKRAASVILKDIDVLMDTLKRRAYEFKETPQMGRSHGIHAEPITFGLKLALWYAEMMRNRARFVQALEDVAVGKISGAVGTFANVDPKVEAYVCEKLGLKPAPISTQIIQRDRHAHFFTTLAILAGSMEKIATEIRHLQRTEVLEAEEHFASGQKGSSAMPHKRNPVGSENISGLARLIRGYAMASLENIPLWHERDISHSSVERVIAPDGCILTDYMLKRLTSILENLTVYPDRMLENLNRTHGLIYSQRVLLALVDKGVKRDEAYVMVQRNAMKAWKGERDFKILLRGDPEIRRYLDENEIDALFDIAWHLKHVSTIFNRVFGDNGT